MANEEKAGAELRQVSQEFVLGLLKVALPPFNIDLAKVRLVLRLAVGLGYDPVLLYQKAVAGRQEGWDEPPLVDELKLGEAEPVESLAEVQEVKEKLATPPTP